MAVFSYRLRRLTPLLTLLALTACAAPFRVPAGSAAHPIVTDGYFHLPDGMRLPYRDWLPAGKPRATVLALHGFNDSRDAWATIGPALARAGIAVYAPDLPGFGATADRGNWVGAARLAGAARSLVVMLRHRYPAVPLTVMGESMGGAVALLLGAQGDADIASYVLISPAVWGGKAMARPLRASLALADLAAPWMRLTGRQAHIKASDDIKALIVLGKDPLTIKATRIATLAGLVRLMDRAQAACARFAPSHALILYGGHDHLIPKAAMADCWRTLPTAPGVRLGFYPPDYHLMLLDHERAIPRADIRAFILHPDRPLPSDAATDAIIFEAAP